MKEKETNYLTENEGRVRLHLAQEVRQLLCRSEEEQLQWHDSRADLMEALSVACQTGLITDDAGQPLCFRTLVKRACQLLHLPEPRNPYDLVQRARMRKGIRRSCYLRRYSILLLMDQHDAPFSESFCNA